MSIISSYKLLLILILQSIHFSESMKNIKESSSIDICKGNDVDLLWKISEGENKLSKLEWYFNNKTICTSSPVEDFTVKTPYQGRIERIGKTEIRLKNVSLDDEGIYILFPLLAWSTSQNMQKIVLRVLEPPTNKCTCKISYMGQPLKFTCELTASYCGRPQVSAVWKRKQTFEALGEGNYIYNSSLQDNEILCCPDGEAMKCVVDSRQFCTSVSIPHRDDERPSQDGCTQHKDSVTMPVFQDRDTGSTDIHYIQPYLLVTLTVSSLAAIFALVALIINCRKRRNNKDVDKWKEQEQSLMRKEISTNRAEQIDKWKKQEQSLMRKAINTNAAEQFGECVPMVEINCKQHEAVKPVIKHEHIAYLTDSMLETEEAITVHKPTYDSETKDEVQELQHAALYPVLETEEAITVHHPTNDSETKIEVQKLQHAALYPVHETEEAITVHQPTNDSETKIEVQKLQHAALYPVPEKAEALTEHHPSHYLETMKEMQELRHAALCKICFANRMSVFFMPCNHIVTCAYCSIALQQCPVCRVLIQMKIDIYFG